MSKTTNDELSELVLANVERRLEENAAQRAIYNYQPSGPGSYLELSLQNGLLMAETDEAITSVVAPYIKHYVHDKMARNEKIPYNIGMAILNLEGSLLDTQYGKYTTQKLRDKIRENMASPEQIPEDALGIGGVDIDVSDLALDRAA